MCPPIIVALNRAGVILAEEIQDVGWVLQGCSTHHYLVQGEVGLLEGRTKVIVQSERCG